MDEIERKTFKGFRNEVLAEVIEYLLSLSKYDDLDITIETLIKGYD